MVAINDLYQGKVLYFYNRDGFLEMCDVVYYPRIKTGFGYILIGDNNLYPLTDKDLERMFNSREEAEQLDLFYTEDW